MQGSPPRVSIGLPVFNGENYLALAIESLLAQTHQDFELIISDNASTDGTAGMCRDYAARDPRIRYYREEENRGAAWNFNRLVALARGEYFKWAAHDDLCAPTWLERCVEILDRDPSTVLSFTRHQPIDAEGKPFNSPRSAAGQAAARRQFNSPSAHRRYLDVLVHCDWCYEMFGLTRTAVMRHTGLQRSYYGGDKMLLVELSLLGRFEESPEVLFFPRQHAAQSSAIPCTAAQQAYVDPAAPKWFGCPDTLRFNGGYLALALTAPAPPAERVRCVLALAGYLARPSKLQRLAGKIGRTFGIGGKRPMHPALARAGQAAARASSPSAPWQSAPGDGPY